eukprot:1253427-Pyramimonas_sp.AAC.1
MRPSARRRRCPGSAWGDDGNDNNRTSIDHGLIRTTPRTIEASSVDACVRGNPHAADNKRSRATASDVAAALE